MCVGTIIEMRTKAVECINMSSQDFLQLVAKMQLSIEKPLTQPKKDWRISLILSNIRGVIHSSAFFYDNNYLTSRLFNTTVVRKFEFEKHDINISIVV